MSNVIPAKDENIRWMRNVIYGGVTEEMIARGVSAYVNYRAMRDRHESIDLRDMITAVLRSSLGDTGDGYSEDAHT